MVRGPPARWTPRGSLLSTRGVHRRPGRPAAGAAVGGHTTVRLGQRHRAASQPRAGAVPRGPAHHPCLGQRGAVQRAGLRLPGTAGQGGWAGRPGRLAGRWRQLAACRALHLHRSRACTGAWAGAAQSWCDLVASTRWTGLCRIVCPGPAHCMQQLGRSPAAPSHQMLQASAELHVCAGGGGLQPGQAPRPGPAASLAPGAGALQAPHTAQQAAGAPGPRADAAAQVHASARHPTASAARPQALGTRHVLSTVRGSACMRWASAQPLCTGHDCCSARTSACWACRL